MIISAVLDCESGNSCSKILGLQNGYAASHEVISRAPQFQVRTSTDLPRAFASKATTTNQKIARAFANVCYIGGLADGTADNVPRLKETDNNNHHQNGCITSELDSIIGETYRVIATCQQKPADINVRGRVPTLDIRIATMINRLSFIQGPREDPRSSPRWAFICKWMWRSEYHRRPVQTVNAHSFMQKCSSVRHNPVGILKRILRRCSFSCSENTLLSIAPVWCTWNYMFCINSQNKEDPDQPVRRLWNVVG